jgi:hypothetical protein
MARPPESDTRGVPGQTEGAQWSRASSPKLTGFATYIPGYGRPLTSKYQSLLVGTKRKEVLVSGIVQVR